MSSGNLDDAIAKARAIAAKLSASVSTSGGGGGGGGGSAGGGAGGQKRGRWGEASDEGLPRKKKKIMVPTDNPEFNFFSLLIGPRGSTQKRLQEETGAHINIRGKGTTKDGQPTGNPEDDEEMHVVIEGTEEQVEAATKEVENILFNPVEAMRLKQQQLRNLAEMKGGMMRPHGDDGGRSRPGLGFDGHYGPRGGEGGEDVEVDEMKVPNAVVGLVIGRGGENIQRISAQTSCFVQVAKEVDMAPGETERTVTLKGSRDAIEGARRIIQDLIDSKAGPGGPRRPGSSMSGGGPDGVPDGSTYGMVHSLSVQVPSDKVGIIIGRQGSTIRGIQDRTGAHVQIPQPGPGDDPNFRTVNITASNLEHAQAAEAEVQGLISGGPGGMMGRGGPPRDPWSAPGAQAMLLHIQNHQVGLIIGRGGAHIREVQNRTGTRIQIPPNSEVPPGVNYRVVTITGPPPGQEQARYEIETKLMNEGCRDPMGNYIPYQPSPCFVVAIGADGTPGGPPPPTGGAPPPPGYGAPPPPGHPPQQPADPYAYYYQQQGQQPPPPGADPTRAPTPSGQSPAPGSAASPAPAHAPAPAPASAAAGQTNGSGGGGEGETDMTQYYDQFWQYAIHYGESFAREKYGVWAPPEGTPCPPHITLPTPEEAAAAIAKAQAEGTL